MLAKLLCTKRKSASAPRCLRCLGATIDIVNSITRTANRSGQGGIFASMFTKGQHRGHGDHWAWRLTGNYCPKIEITAEMAQERPDLKPLVGRKLTVIAWLWARTVKSPNPAFANVEVPLASTFMLSTKAGKEAYVEPVIEGAGYRFTVKVGKPNDAEAAKNGTKLSRGANFRCLMSETPIGSEH